MTQILEFVKRFKLIKREINLPTHGIHVTADTEALLILFVEKFNELEDKITDLEKQLKTERKKNYDVQTKGQDE